MKINYIFLLILFNLLIGINSSDPDVDEMLSRLSCNTEASKCSSSSSYSSILSDSKLRELKIENVQLTEYKNGQITKLPQQDYKIIQKDMKTNGQLFVDNLFIINFILTDKVPRLPRPKDIVEKPVLISDENRKFDIKQGYLGSCWFLTAVINLRRYKSLFSVIVPPKDQSFEDDKYAGIFHFRFWQAGRWVDVVVDDQLPPTDDVKTPTYVTSGVVNEFWPTLVEKSYAKLIYRSYELLGEGSLSKISMQDFSGGISEMYLIKYTKESLFEILVDAFKRKTMVSCATPPDDIMVIKAEQEFGLVAEHSYAITDVKILKGINNNRIKLIRICDPRGYKFSNIYPGEIKDKLTTEKTSELQTLVDGECWILYEDFIKYFLVAEICNLTPNIITGDIYAKDGKTKLALTSDEGKLIGSVDYIERTNDINDFFIINQQYRIVLTKSDNSGSNKCSILIGLSLKRRDDLEKVSDTLIAFTLISFNDNIEVPRPLDSSSDNKSYMKYLQHYYNYGQVSRRVELYPGTYYLIPFAKETFAGATYFLQILSEEPNILEIYDRDIEVPDIENKLNSLLNDGLDNDNPDYNLFKNYALEDETIDYKNLHAILNNNQLSLYEKCESVMEIDEIASVKLQEYFQQNVYGPLRRFSRSTLSNIELRCQEIFDTYKVPNYPGYIFKTSLSLALKLFGYDINQNLLGIILTKYVDSHDMISYNGFVTIVLTFKSTIGTNCEEFRIELCYDMITMIPDHIQKVPDSNSFGKINFEQFKIIIQFIKKLKELYHEFSVKSFGLLRYEDLRKILDKFGYKLSYKILAVLINKYREFNYITLNQFIHCVVQTTKIFGKIHTKRLNEHNENLDVMFIIMFNQFWEKINDKKMFEFYDIDTASTAMKRHMDLSDPISEIQSKRQKHDNLKYQ